MAERLLDEEFTYDDGSRVVVVAYRVPESEHHPEGVKYRFQYMDENGTTLLRYDDAHDQHDRHRDGDVEAVTFTSLTTHYRRFRREVERIHDRRTER